MSKRINIVLPEGTLAILDRVAAKGNRSQFISRAVLHFVGCDFEPDPLHRPAATHQAIGNCRFRDYEEGR